MTERVSAANQPKNGLWLSFVILIRVLSFYEKLALRMSIDRHSQGENRVKENCVWEMKNDFFISAGFASVNKDRCKSGLSGIRHFGNFQVWMGCKSCRLKTTERTSEDRKAQQTAKDGNFRNAVDRQSEQRQTAQE
jgi:hypothetical protein